MSTVEDDEQDLTRKQRREQARATRKELEQAQLARAVRRTRLTQLAIVVTVVVVGLVIALVATSGGGTKHTPTTGSGASTGLQTTPAPWPPEYSGLEARLLALNLPSQSDNAYHVHADLQVYVEGRQVPVPANIGIDPEGRFLAPLHTNDTSGVIHMEASAVYPFKLGQVFTIWGLKFTSTQLGGYVAGGGNILAVYVNGKPVTNPVEYVMQPHDLILVGYGKPGSFPTSFNYSFPGGL